MPLLLDLLALIFLKVMVNPAFASAVKLPSLRHGVYADLRRSCRRQLIAGFWTSGMLNIKCLKVNDCV